MEKRKEVLPLSALNRIYPYNLAFDIGLEMNEIYLVNPIDLVATVAYDLLEREAFVIFEYYGVENKILDEIAKDLGVTRERVRQIKAKALRKLRHPKRVRKYTAVSRKAYDTATIGFNMKEDTNKEPAGLKIIELDLSVRTFNSVVRYLKLKRGKEGFLRAMPDKWEVNDLLGLSLDELMGIRNLGRKSLEELLTALKEKANVVLVDGILTDISKEESK